MKTTYFPVEGGLTHLVVPRLPAEHLGALEARRQAADGESSALWEKLHVDALAEVDEDEAVVDVLRLETLVLQEPKEQQRRPLSRLWNADGRRRTWHFRCVYFSPSMKLSGLTSAWTIRTACSCSTMFRMQTVKYMTSG